MERSGHSEVVFHAENARKHEKGRESTLASPLSNIHTHEVTGSSPVVRTRKSLETQRFMFIGTQCDLWGRPDGTGHEKNKSREIPSTYFFFDPKFI